MNILTILDLYPQRKWLLRLSKICLFVSTDVSILSAYTGNSGLIRSDMDPKFLSGLGKIRIMHIHVGIACIGRDLDIPICPVYTKIRITHVRIKQSCLYFNSIQHYTATGHSKHNTIPTKGVPLLLLQHIFNFIGKRTKNKRKTHPITHTCTSPGIKTGNTLIFLHIKCKLIHKARTCKMIKKFSELMFFTIHYVWHIASYICPFV